MIAAMNSVASNAKRPQELRFNIAAPHVKADVAKIEAALSDAFQDAPFQWRVSSAQAPDWVTDYVQARFIKPDELGKSQGTDAHEDALHRKAMIFARMYLPLIFADLGKVIYLDCDVIVRDDIAKLWADAAVDAKRPFAAARHLYLGQMYFRKPFKHWRWGRKMRRPFNSGMFVSDVTAWDGAPMDELARIIEWDRREGYVLFDLVDEAMLNLMFADYLEVSARWNRCGYGNHPLVARLLKKPLSEISVIHWSGGQKKPWRQRDTIYAEEWWTYDKGPLPE